MNKQEVTELALKLLGLCCLIYALSILSNSLNILLLNKFVTTPFNNWFSWALSSLAVMGGPLIAGTVLLLCAKKLSNSLFNFENPATTTLILIKINAKELHCILLSLFGFALILGAVVPLFNYLAFIFEPTPDYKDTFSNTVYLLSLLLKPLLGLWFAIGSKGIIGIIYRLRHAGI